MDMLEFNQVLIEGERQTLSLIAEKGSVTVLTGVSDEILSLYFQAILGFVNILNGHICIDGEPLTAYSAASFRRQMAYAPSKLRKLGEVVNYEPPSVQDIFSLKVNRSLPISNGILAEEMKKVGGDSNNDQIQLIAVAALLEKPIMLIENPPVESMPYLRQLAAKDKIVLLTSNDGEVLSLSHKTVNIY